MLTPSSKYLTTGQVARFCGVNFRTVIRWIKKGYLQAHRLPGRGDHRVSMADLTEFMKKFDLKLPESMESVQKEEGLGKKQRILIVEDDPAAASAIQRVLRLQGYETKVACGGFEAGLVLQGFRPALLTLDLLMPGLDGLTVLKTIRSNPDLAAVKVLVISGDTDHRLKTALNLGADLTLPKPFSREDLLSSVNALMGRSKLGSQTGGDT